MEERVVEQWSNPLIEQRADPWMMLHQDGYYYFTATVPEYNHIELRRSKTINGLSVAETKIIWNEHEDGPIKHHIWAPEIHYIKGKWYIYFAAGHAEDEWRIRMYVLECEDANPLEGKWVEKGQIQTPWDSFSLDATPFEYNNKLYLIWAQSDPKIKGNSNLYIDEMLNPWTLSGQQAMISTPEYDWERIGFNVNEGPAVLKANGKIYVTYSASKTDYNYCIGLLEIDEKKDFLKAENWVKHTKPVFTTYAQNSQFGPGHNSFVRIKGTQQIGIVYHARSYRNIDGDPLSDPNRHTRVQLIDVQENGVDFGVPVKNGIYQQN
jgi:GH43 family beta-xylosidase